jgi:hypothetical protein
MVKLQLPVIRKLPTVDLFDVMMAQPMQDPTPPKPGVPAMMNIRQRSVNVNRLELLDKLRENLAIHRAEYLEALDEYQARLLADLKLAVEKVNSTQNPKDLQKFSFDIQFPPNHEQDFLDVIEMLEMSVDSTINLDSESFKAYIKNEWNWQHHFRAAKMAYVTAGSSLSL